jgi:hypothetical protein
MQKKRSPDSKQAGSNDKQIYAIASPTNQNITKARSPIDKASAVFLLSC